MTGNRDSLREVRQKHDQADALGHAGLAIREIDPIVPTWEGGEDRGFAARDRAAAYGARRLPVVHLDRERPRVRSGDDDFETKLSVTPAERQLDRPLGIGQSEPDAGLDTRRTAHDSNGLGHWTQRKPGRHAAEGRESL